MGPSLPLLLAFMTLSLFSPSFAASTKLVNITVDDTEGYAPENLVINYSPAGSWSPGQNCTDCEADLDPSQVNDGTWHDTTYFPDSPPSSPLTANLTFDGVAIYVFCIITRASTDPYGNTDMTFYLDGEEVGTYVKTPDGDSTYQYHVPVYANESLAAGTHTISLVNGRSGGLTALALFDYMVFSREASDSSSISSPTSTSVAPAVQSTGSTSSVNTNSQSSHGHAATIAGSIVGVVLAVAIVAAALVCYRRRRTRAGRPSFTFDESDKIESLTLSRDGPVVFHPSMHGAHTHDTRVPDPYLVPRADTAAPREKSLPTLLAIPPSSPTATSSSSSGSGTTTSYPSERPLPTTPDRESATPSGGLVHIEEEEGNSPSAESPVSPRTAVKRRGPWNTVTSALEQRAEGGKSDSHMAGGPSGSARRASVGGAGARSEVGTEFEEGPPSYAAAVHAGRPGGRA